MNKLMTWNRFFISDGWRPEIAGRRLAAAASLFAAAMLLAGCATATIEDAVPQGALEQPADNVTQADTEMAVSSGEPDNTGEFPNLNETQHGEMAQMTPAEKRAYLEKLRAARAAQTAKGGGADRPASKAELKKLARTHDDETLKEIEAGSEDPGATD